jgi:hypothetical protein
MGGEPTEGSFERVCRVDGPVTLDVSVDSGFVRVRAGESGTVQVRGILRARRWLFDWGNAEERIRQLEAQPPVDQQGNCIRVGDAADRWLLRGVSLFLEIAVPAPTTIRALGDSGDIRVEGIDGPVTCETGSGEIEVSGIASDVSASTDSGAVRIRRIRGRVRVSTDHGEIEALEIAGPIEASTDHGEMRLSQTMAAPIRAESDHGGISVKLAPEAGYSVSVRTDHGTITVPSMEVRDAPTSKEVNGRIRGGGPVVDLETDHGDIDIA